MMKFLFHNTRHVESNDVVAKMPEVAYEAAYREDGGVDRQEVTVYVERKIGVVLHCPRIVEREVNSSDDLGLRYVGFVPTLDESEARAAVTRQNVIGLFQSMGKSNTICGYGLYR